MEPAQRGGPGGSLAFRDACAALVCVAGWIGMLAGPSLAAPPAMAAARGLIDQGRYSEAEQIARETLRGLQAPDRSLERAEALGILVETLWRTGRVDGDEAIASARQAAAITEEVLGARSAAMGAALRNLGRVLEFRGQYAEARSVLEQALEIHEAVVAAGVADAGAIEVARTLDALADVLIELPEPAEAERLYERAIAITSEVYGPGHADNAEYLRNLGRIRRDAGDYEGAVDRLERALAIATRTLAPGHPRLVWFLNSYAIAQEQIGNIAEARSLYDQALVIARATPPPPDHRLVACLNNLGALLIELGNHEGATKLLEESLALTRILSGARHPDVARAIANLASADRLAGRLESAESRYREALSINQESLGPDHPAVAEDLGALADLAKKRGKLGEARSLLETALSIRVVGLGPGHFDYARGQQDLAGVLEAEGRLTDAADRYRAAIAIFKRVYGDDHPVLASAGTDLSRTLARMGRSAEALPLALQAESIERDHQRLLTATLVEREALRFAEVRSRGIDVALSLAARGADATDTRSVWDALIRSRALILDTMAWRHREIQAQTGIEVDRLKRAFVEASRRLANLMSSGPEGDAGPYRSLIDSAREERERVEAALARKNQGFARARTRIVLGLEKVERSLPEGSALLAYAIYRPVISPAGAEGRYVAFLLRQGDRHPRVVELGTVSEIDTLVHAWRSEVSHWPFADQDAAKAEARVRERGETLRRRVWDPLAGGLESVTRLFVVPDGALNLVSFQALPAPAGGYLVEHLRTLHYLSAERDLVPDSTERRVGRGLLAVGGPDYDADLRPATPGRPVAVGLTSSRTRSMDTSVGSRTACRTLRGARFEPLPGTDLESRQVVEIATRAGEAATRLAGREATETSFKRQAPGRRILHLATHGFFTGACAPTPGRGIGAIAPARVPADDVRTVDNPLLLAGLALAGANRREAVGPDSEDGILTAEEIAAMDLTGVEWAVLSACDTGVGTTTTGEGVLGLRRSFQIAGAGTVIMSLWAVQDDAAREWVQALYRERFSEGRETAEAMRRASLEVLQRRRQNEGDGHPLFWGPFVALGNWQ